MVYTVQGYHLGNRACVIQVYALWPTLHNLPMQEQCMPYSYPIHKRIKSPQFYIFISALWQTDKQRFLPPRDRCGENGMSAMSELRKHPGPRERNLLRTEQTLPTAAPSPPSMVEKHWCTKPIHTQLCRDNSLKPEASMHIEGGEKVKEPRRS